MTASVRSNGQRPGCLTTIDTVPRFDLPILSDGNFAEVAPPRLSPMSWSLVGFPMERAARALAEVVLPAHTWYRGSRFVFVGFYALKPYHNLSSFCSMASQMPGLSMRAVTDAYFEGTAPPAMFAPARATAVERALMPSRFLRYWHRTVDLRAVTEARVAEMEGRLGIGRPGGELRCSPMAVVRELAVVLHDAWRAHIASTSASMVFGTLLERVGGRLVRHWDDLAEHFMSPRSLVWNRLYGPAGSCEPGAGDFLHQPFYEIANTVAPWSTYARPRHSADPTLPAAPDRGAIDIGRVVGRDRVSALDLATSWVRKASEEREESKSLVMRSLDLARRVVPALAAEMGVETWPYLTFAELTGMGPETYGRKELIDRSLRRKGDCDVAAGLNPPGRLDLRDAYPAHRTASDGIPDAEEGRVLVPAASGADSVTATVVRWPVDDFDTDGRIVLVCESADSEIQPLLPHVDGVVVARGSLMSHVAILCRAAGLPCIVASWAREVADGEVVSFSWSTTRRHTDG